ncbi:MAG: hypothetical protein ABIA77_05110 [Candidatus Omnitrophota bacterium]
MKNRAIKTALIIFSVVFALRILTIFSADRLYSMSLAAETGKITPDRAIGLLNEAINLDSANANLYYRKYELLNLKLKKGQVKPGEDRKYIFKQELNLLKECINLCPSWPAYHLHYALTLKQMSPHPNIMTKARIQSEFQKAAELKPFSDLYQKFYKENRSEQ